MLPCLSGVRVGRQALQTALSALPGSRAAHFTRISITNVLRDKTNSIYYQSMSKGEMRLQHAWQNYGHVYLSTGGVLSRMTLKYTLLRVYSTTTVCFPVL